MILPLSRISHLIGHNTAAHISLSCAALFAYAQNLAAAEAFSPARLATFQIPHPSSSLSVTKCVNLLYNSYYFL